MSRNAWLGTLVVLAVIVVGGYYALNKRASNTVVNNNVQTPPAPQPGTASEKNNAIPPAGNAPSPVNHVLSMTDAGFSPATLNIKKGDTVAFTNNGTALHWPASAPHPTHTNYPGFDAGRALEPGESWTFQFDKIGTWTYHDHLNPATKGTIVVK